MTQKLDQLEKLKEKKNIYFHREVITYSLEGRPVEMVTLSSKDRIVNEEEDEREPPLPNLFPELTKSEDRPLKFKKKTIVISSRVHPGESGASFMFNGLLDLILE